MPRTHRLDAQRAVFCHALGRAEPRGHSAPEQWTARLPALSDAVDTPLQGFWPHFAPCRFSGSKRETANPPEFAAASWTKAALRWSGPERTRRTEPRWGAVSVGCRAIRLPGGRRRDLLRGAVVSGDASAMNPRPLPGARIDANPPVVPDPPLSLVQDRYGKEFWLLTHATRFETGICLRSKH